jgi:2-succinyl-6-hydroxy-2,4-cyclohexadiene-1-carboxylate synthase
VSVTGSAYGGVVHSPKATPVAVRTAGSGPPVLLLHGFTQTGACLGPLADDLARDHTVVLPDLPGHGGSAGVAGAGLWDAADLLADVLVELVATHGDGAVPVLGYSLGGRTALHLALARPDLVRSLVLVGATAGIEDPAERAARAASDDALADRIEQIGVEAFLGEWLAQPLFAALPPWARFDDERRTNTAAGLADSLRHAGTGRMDPLWDRLGALDVPVRCLAGERDARFAALARRLAHAVGPSGSVGLVPGAGHAAHLEAPAAVVGEVRTILGTQPPR